MPLTWEGTQNCLLPLNNRFCYFLEVGFHKIISWRYVYFDGLEVPSLSVVVQHQSRAPRAMLGSLLPLRYHRGIAGKRGVGCYIHKCHGLEPPALSDTGITRSTTSFPERLHPPSLRVRSRTCSSRGWNAGMLLKPCLPSAVVLYDGAARPGAAFSFA